MAFTHPEYLISPEALAAKLGNDNLRLYDVTVHLAPNPKGGYKIQAGQEAYAGGHVPGADFLNQITQLSDSSSALGFTRLQDDLLIRGFADAGVGADSDVVFYSSDMTVWATRAWWLLHYCGHKQVAILDGGLGAWNKAGLDSSTEPASYAAQSWSSITRPELFADQAAVMSAIGDVGICTVNALSPAIYAGTSDIHYGRRGHIPNSINLFCDTLLDDECFRSPEEVRQSLSDSGLLDDRQIIAYCGGGVAATIDAFACMLSGKKDVAVYDGSMSEWARDESLPLTEGSNP